MTQEILLEIINHRNGLAEKLRRLATVHQDGLGAKHLGYLGQHTRAALGHQPIAELAHKGISGDTTEAIGTSALQAYTELGYRYVDSLVLTCFLIKFAQNLHACFHLVAIHLLGHHQADALLVIVAQKLHEVIGLVVLAT